MFGEVLEERLAPPLRVRPRVLRGRELVLGVVDVLVTGPDGQSQRVTAASTYAAPESFDMNGTWDGISINGTDTAIHFVIQNNRLGSAACSYDVYMPYPLVEFPAAAGGEFAVTLPGGQAISGRIVSASQIIGIFTYPMCTSVTSPFVALRAS